MSSPLSYRDSIQELISRANQDSRPANLRRLLDEEVKLINRELASLLSPTWAQLSRFLASVVQTRFAWPQTKLTASPPYQEGFKGLELQKLLSHALKPISDSLQGRLVSLAKKDGLGEGELVEIISIGLPEELKDAPRGYQLFRIAALAELRTKNYQLERVAKNVDPEREFAKMAKVGLLFRWGPLQMVMVEESARIDKLVVLLTDDYFVQNDRVFVRSALFYDRNRRLTLAGFSQPTEVAYVIFHPSSADYAKMEKTGIPMQSSYWAKELIEAKGSKLGYPELLADSEIVFPKQLNLYRREAPQDRQARETWVSEKLAGFVKKNQVRSIFVKPAAGSKGGGTGAFTEIDLSKKRGPLVNFITRVLEKQGDVLVQELVELMPLEQLMKEEVLEEIFGRQVELDKLDWVIRSVASRDQEDQLKSVCRFIVANDQGVANVGQGAVTILFERLSRQLDWQVLDRLTNRFAQLVKKEAEAKSELKRARDKRTNHLPDYLITEWFYDQQERFVFLEAGLGIGICRSFQHYLEAVKKIRNPQASDYWLIPVLRHITGRSFNSLI